jgi:hypothetical protein
LALVAQQHLPVQVAQILYLARLLLLAAVEVLVHQLIRMALRA